MQLVSGKQFFPKLRRSQLIGQITKIISNLCLVHIRRNMLDFLRLQFIPPSFTGRSSAISIHQHLLNDLADFQVCQLRVHQVVIHLRRLRVSVLRLFQNLWNSTTWIWFTCLIPLTQNFPAKFSKAKRMIHFLRDYT
jgi:hypothetical protein